MTSRPTSSWSMALPSRRRAGATVQILVWSGWSRTGSGPLRGLTPILYPTLPTGFGRTNLRWCSRIRWRVPGRVLLVIFLSDDLKNVTFTRLQQRLDLEKRRSERAAAPPLVLVVEPYPLLDPERETMKRIQRPRRHEIQRSGLTDTWTCASTCARSAGSIPDSSQYANGVPTWIPLAPARFASSIPQDVPEPPASRNGRPISHILSRSTASLGPISALPYRTAPSGPVAARCAPRPCSSRPRSRQPVSRYAQDSPPAWQKRQLRESAGAPSAASPRRTSALNDR